MISGEHPLNEERLRLTVFVKEFVNVQNLSIPLIFREFYESYAYRNFLIVHGYQHFLVAEMTVKYIYIEIVMIVQNTASPFPYLTVKECMEFINGHVIRLLDSHW